MKKYKLYYLYTPHDGKVFYIGITKQKLKRRFNGHISHSIKERRKFHINNKICNLIKNSIKFNIDLLLEFENKEECCQAEIKYIAWVKSMNFKLCNISSGGDHPIISDEQKKKMSLSKNPNLKFLTKEFLNENYILNKKNIKEIAAEIGCHSDSVRKKIKQFGFKTRPGRLLGDKNPSKKEETRKKISKSKIGKARPDLALRNEGNTKKVYQFSLQNEFIREYSSVTAATISMNCSKSAIANACTGFSKTCKNFIWSYNLC